MRNEIELLAPGGDLDSIKAAIVAGADAIYCGLGRFNARTRAVNISLDDLNGILKLAHSNSCQIFLTLNIIIVESEIPAFVNLLNKLVNSSIDGIILQDLGMIYLVSKYFPDLKVHGSTQLTTHNEGQIHFLSELNVSRANLCRELSIDEIKTLAHVGHQNNVFAEVFVHGSNCISFSGLCYISSVLKGNSGNRGRCSQPCRDEYLQTPRGKHYPLNLKDNSAFQNLQEIMEAGVDSIKIEGRIKKFHYVYTVVNSWKKQIEKFYKNNEVSLDDSALHKVFNRDFTNAFLMGDINKQMFIDNPRDNSAIHLTQSSSGCLDKNINIAKKTLYDEKTTIITDVEKKINQLTIAKDPVVIRVFGKFGTLLEVTVQTPDSTFVVASKTELVHGGLNTSGKKKNKVSDRLDYQSIFSRLKAINDTEFYIDDLDVDQLQDDLFLPFKEITAIKRRILFILNGSREFVDPIVVPVLKPSREITSKPTLSVLISSVADLYLCDQTSADIYFQLPNCFPRDSSTLGNLFSDNKRVIPWFPAVLIGDAFKDAVRFLERVRPKTIVTNNSGIAFEAYKLGISWVAGPFLNIVNSFSLQCLKERFGCSGAYISNEINRLQIKSLKRPEGFKLYYSIYHPLLLMTSRQCLLHQVDGCDKDSVRKGCIETCHRSTSITNLQEKVLYIEKSKGDYHSIYNNENFLNLDIIKDLPGKFSGFLVDLRKITTETHVGTEDLTLITLFQNILDGDPEAEGGLLRLIQPTTKKQYLKGL